MTTSFYDPIPQATKWPRYVYLIQRHTVTDSFKVHRDPDKHTVSKFRNQMNMRKVHAVCIHIAIHCNDCLAHATCEAKDRPFFLDTDGIYATRANAMKKIEQLQFSSVRCLMTIVKPSWVGTRSCVYVYVYNSNMSCSSCCIIKHTTRVHVKCCYQ
jgi:hypothetical protein